MVAGKRNGVAGKRRGQARAAGKRRIQARAAGKRRGQGHAAGKRRGKSQAAGNPAAGNEGDSPPTDVGSVLPPMDNNDGHLCVTCGKRFGNKTAFEQHVSSSHADRPCRCSICRNVFRSREEKKAHYAAYHLPDACRSANPIS